jgi:hypothetical protein
MLTSINLDHCYADVRTQITQKVYVTNFEHKLKRWKCFVDCNWVILIMIQAFKSLISIRM